MGISIDFTGADVRALLPVGAYPITVTNVEVREGPSGKYLNWEFQISDGEFQNQKLWMVTSLTPKSLWKLKETLIALGADPANLAGETDIDPEDFIGAEAMAIVAQVKRTDTGEMKNEVSKLQAGEVEDLNTSPAPSAPVSMAPSPASTTAPKAPSTAPALPKKPRFK